jgi:hypothetical protein
VVRLPLAYPDPAGAFYGYDSRTVRLPDGAEARSTRNLIRVTGWAATALLAHQAGRYVARKRDCHATYRAAIGDEWSDLLADIYTRCRAEWNYLIPDDAADRRRLRAICERTLAFENQFLAIYRRYLLTELRGADDGHARQALWLLGQIPYDDDEVRAVVRARAEAGDAQLREAARQTLRALPPAREEP